MATYIQRGQNIGNALINGVATLTQLDRLGKALAYQSTQLDAYLAGDNNVKAEIYVTAFRQFCLNALKEYEGSAAEAAAVAATAATVETDFPQAP